MEITNLIASLFTLEGYAHLLEILILISLAVYVVVAFLISRSVALMNKSFNTDASLLFRLLGIFHLLISLLLLLVAYIIL